MLLVDLLRGVPLPGEEGVALADDLPLKECGEGGIFLKAQAIV